METFDFKQLVVYKQEVWKINTIFSNPSNTYSIYRKDKKGNIEIISEVKGDNLISIDKILKEYFKDK